ncbi:MAG: sulfatase, partial [Planctomycetota bacterium]|nr:sulfatase [Planctomycetota bacterium]
MTRSGFLCLASLLAAVHGRGAERPNIVFVFADDLGWADVGYNGAKFYETPNIDALARSGVILDRFYPGGPNCMPSRACIMSGCYTPRHHLYTPGGRSKGDRALMRFRVPARGGRGGRETIPSKTSLPASFVSIAEVLKPAGYATARIGKWHLGDDTQGFDLSTNNGEPNVVTGSFYRDIHVAEAMTDAALDFITANKERRFFLYVAHWEVHTALAAEKSIVARYRQKKTGFPDKSFDWNPTYAAEIEVVDRSVGRIRAQLKELELEDRTLFIFSSDNGGLPGVTTNRPLRGGKGSLFEGGIRTPFCAAWPGVIRPGSRSDEPVTGVDLLPTFAELARAPLPETQPADGRSILPLLSGEGEFASRAIFWHYPLYLSGGRGNKVLPVHGTNRLYWRAVPASAIVKGDWKLIHYYEYDESRLFNLRRDTSEANDLAKTAVAKTV